MAAVISPIACVDGGVDYLTCTFNQTVDHGLLNLLVSRVQRREAREGNRITRWGMAGYEGKRVGGIEFGTRHDGAIVRLSGFSAQQWWRRFGKLATNCSRIDLQQTFIYDEPFTKTLARHWREMKRHYQAGKRRPKPRVFHGPDGPETIYSGERVSETYLRIYHRGSKPGLEHAQGHVRYEAEYKDARSWAILKELLPGKNQNARAAGYCLASFCDRGCRLSWSNVTEQRAVCSGRTSDVTKSLAWLANAVRPSIEYLFSVGMEEEVFRALGLLQIPTDES